MKVNVFISYNKILFINALIKYYVLTLSNLHINFGSVKISGSYCDGFVSFQKYLTKYLVIVLNMSICVLSDDSDHSNHDEFDFMKKYEEDACVDLTQEDVEPYSEPYQSPYHDPYEDMLPEIHLTGPVAGLGSSHGASTSSGGTLTSSTSSSGYGGSECSTGSKRVIGSTEDKRKKKTDKEAKKLKLAQERAAKLAAAEANKVYKPGECMKYMHIEMHPSLLEQWFCADVPREVTAAGARVEATRELCDPALVMWSRRVPQALTASNGQVALSPGRQRCPRAVYVSAMSEAASLVRARSLAPHVAQAAALADCPVTLVIHGVKDYFKSSNRRTQNSSRELITPIELEMALTDLLVSAGCDAALVDTPNELALLIAQFTKAIAEEPHKKIKRNFDEQAEFYMRGDSKKCVAVDKDGNGASRLWQQMIAVLPGSSLETSRSVCGQYKSPLALYQALQLPNGVNDLADIGVSRTGVPGSKSRRLGPEFARKLRILFTAEDGDVLID